MGLEKRTVKIIIIVVVTLLIIGGVVGLLLGLLLPQRYIVLEAWPRSEDYTTWDEPLIQYRADDPGSWHPWVHRINDFLKVYETTVPEEPPRAPCSTRHHSDMQVRSRDCDQAMQRWRYCTADNFYGYPEGQPCVFLRLSHVHYWVPEPYNMSMPLPFPPDIPENVMNLMRQFPTRQFGDHVWVTCDGEHSGDKESIGPILYYPDVVPGFPTRRLYTADRLGRSGAARAVHDHEPGPLVAVHFEKPRRGVLINVECRIWTRDYYYDRSSKIGRTRFELYVD